MDSSYLKWDSTHVRPLLWATKGNLSLFDVLKLSSVRFELCYNQIRKNSLDVTFVFLSITATFFTLNNSQILNKIAGYRIHVLVSTTVNGPMPDVCHRCTINTEFYFRNFVNSLLKITIYAKSINYSVWISGCHISAIIKIDTAFIKRWTYVNDFLMKLIWLQYGVLLWPCISCAQIQLRLICQQLEWISINLNNLIEMQQGMPFEFSSTVVYFYQWHINKLYIISKCIEVYDESCTLVKRSFLIAIKF